jgi:hypothetical protein
MTAPEQRPAPAKKPLLSGPLLAIGAVVAVAICCGLPVLVAAGVLAVVGGVLGNPWVIAAAAALALGTFTYFVYRGRVRAAACRRARP